MVIIEAGNGVTIACGNDHKECLEDLVRILNDTSEESAWFQTVIDHEFLEVIIDE
jgi:hypothetical protein